MQISELGKTDGPEVCVCVAESRPVEASEEAVCGLALSKGPGVKEKRMGPSRATSKWLLNGKARAFVSQSTWPRVPWRRKGPAR